MNKFKSVSLVTLLTLSLVLSAVGPFNIKTVSAADTGWNAPSANSNVGWDHPSYAYTSDSQRAVADSSSDVVQYYDFDIPAIPIAATINGIEVKIEGYNTGSRQAEVSLSWNNGSNYTTASGVKTTNVHTDTSSPYIDDTTYLGGASDTWNRTWAYGDFTNAKFRLKLDATSGDSSKLYINQISVKIYYEPIKVTICHSDGGSGKYSQIDVDTNAVDGVGGSDHNSHSHQGGKDIIPPGEWDTDGRNWDTEGQAIWNNGCVVPPTPSKCQEGETFSEFKYDSKPQFAYIDNGTTNLADQLCGLSYLGVDTSNGLPHYIYLTWDNLGDISTYENIVKFNLLLNHKEDSATIKVELKNELDNWIEVCDPTERSSFTEDSCDLSPYFDTLKQVGSIELRVVATKSGTCHEYLKCAKLEVELYNCEPPAPFCGDGKVNLPNEVCELPNTTDNSYCVQSTSDCSGVKTITRDAFGNCDGACGCIFDSWSDPICVKDSCGATCAVDADCDDQNPNTDDSCSSETCSCSHEPTCIPEGETGAVVPGQECCQGLTPIGTATPDQSGNCPEIPPVGAFMCTMCGNGTCGLGENKCNCPQDCEEPGYCGDGDVNSYGEECDGEDMGQVGPGDYICSSNCKLIPIYNGDTECPQGTTPEKVGETYSVSSTDADGIAISITDNKTYLFRASGTFIPTSAQGYLSDAGYTTINGLLAPQYGIQGTGNDYAAHALLGDLGIGVGVINWGTYNSIDHTYNFVYTIPTGFTSAQFVIGDRYDEWFDTPWQNQSGMSDNSGNLSLDIYECKSAPECQTNADCNDQNACTTDACDTEKGKCVHAGIDCFDQDPCTDDSCNPTSGCVFTENDECTACDPNIELITNGGFETPEVTNSALWDIFSGGLTNWITNWRDTSPTSWNGYDRPAAYLELQKGVAGDPEEGLQLAELDSDWFGPSNPISAPAATVIYQDISTVPGRQYTISFWFSPRPNTTAEDNALGFSWNGVDQGTVSNGATTGNTNWKQYTYTLTATGSTTRIQFTDMGQPSDSLGTYLDDVSVRCCQTPPVPVCGNSIIENGEQCDDGNTANGDGCSSTCQTEQSCQPTTEICTDQIDNDCDGLIDCADPNCSEAANCIQVGCQPGATESCSTGLLGICAAGTKTCSQLAVWGDCIQNNQPTTEICDGIDNNCNGAIDEDLICINTVITGGGGGGGGTNHLVTCGDGIRELTEQCDDGNTINGDGCSSTCTIEQQGEVLGATTEELPETGTNPMLMVYGGLIMAFGALIRLRKLALN